MVRLTEVRDSPPAPDVEVLFKEAKRLERRRRLLAGVLAIALIGAALLGVLLSSGGTPSTKPSPPKVGDNPRPPVSRTPQVTTAYVVDAAGLVPVDLAINQVGPAITVPGFSYGGSYSNVAVAPDGKTAYVVTTPIPSHAGIDIAGPAVASINLLTKQVEGKIAFPASAVQPGQSGPQPSFYIDALAITPNGRTLLIADAGDDTLIPINVATRTVGRPIALPEEQPLSSLIKSSSSASPNYSPRSPAPISDLVVSPDGRTAYAVDGYVVVPVDLVKGRAEKPIKGFDGPQQLAISPNGMTAYVTNPYCWEIIKTGQCQTPPARPIAEPNGDIQLAAVGDHVSVVDLSHDRISRNIDVGKEAEPEGVALSPTGSTLYITYGKYGQDGERVGVLDPFAGKTVSLIHDSLRSPDTGSSQIAVTPNGNTAFVSGFEVITPGPDGPVVFRGVVPIDLKTGVAGAALSFGAPVKYGLSTGKVVFGQ